MLLASDSIAEKPTASIPSACGGWAETAAAYRFLAQDELDWRDILAPHCQS
ncbi:transposase [Cupriavidus taiwanensis]|uniref:Transposase n=2 Tax=Cupriavidus TaxID=106589 RepID=B2AKD0_CUPTR